MPQQEMTENHIRLLLATLVSLDSRLATPDRTSDAIRVSAWLKLLGEVDPAYAMRHAERAYQQVRDWPLQPAEILQAWRADQAAGQRVQETQAVREESARLLPGAGEAMRRYVRDVWDAVQNGRAWDSVARPPQVVTISRAQDERERRCPHHRLCACTHDRCRAGWLDAEAVIIGVNGREYPAVQECSWCRDAKLMAEELGQAPRPGTRTAGRRR